MSDIIFKKLNESYAYIETDDIDLLQDIYKLLSFFVPGYRFMPSYKQGWFDGQIHLLNLRDKTFPLGLVQYVYDWCYNMDIQCTTTMDVDDSFYEDMDELSIDEFINGLNFYGKKQKIKIREDQIKSIKRAIIGKRCVNQCPTSFGKSLSITVECLWHISKGRRCLIIVPTKDLVKQFFNDICDYATNEKDEKEPWYPKCQEIYAGKSKELDDDTNICISTWQSLSKIEDKNYVNQFDLIVVDECHKCAGNVLQKIMLQANEVKYRTGWTGTLANEKTNELLVKGLFGPAEEIITTKELMDKKIVAELTICVVRLKYPENLSKEVINLDYNKQTEYIENCIYRTNVLLQIVGSQPKTGLLFYKHISHGEQIFEMARKMFPNRNVYLVHGGHFQMNDTIYKSFEELKVFIEEDPSGIIVANYQIASTGISIKNLYWVMFFMPIKSYISCVQSIGRALRINSVKRKALLFDIVDDFSIKKKSSVTENFALKHFAERYMIYNHNHFEYKMCKIDMLPPVQEIQDKEKIEGI